MIVAVLVSVFLGPVYGCCHRRDVDAGAGGFDEYRGCACVALGVPDRLSAGGVWYGVFVAAVDGADGVAVALRGAGVEAYAVAPDPDANL